MRSAQLPEHGNGSDDNNATAISLQVLKQRKRARSLFIDTKTRTFETPDHDSDRLLDGPHLVKRQRPSLRTGDELVPKRTLTPNPQSSQDNGRIGSG